MKKIILSLVTVLVLVTLAACGGNDDAKKDSAKLVVGASNVPHAEILEKAKPLLAKEGVELEIKKYQDYILPNKQLASGDLDANYFQHIPYLEQYNKDNETDLVSAGKIHIEPFGIYSAKFKKVSDIKDGATILISNSTADQGRILMLLEQEGLVKINDSIKDKVTATIKDIDNIKHLKFLNQVDPGLLAQAYKNEEADLYAINTNYAIDAGLQPTEDALILENSDSPYANIVAVNKADKDNANIKKLIKVLHSKAIQDFITDKYEGAVLPTK
ncbi:MetQ/NlpA family ABC transporter substrate-binding protein [Brochothrix campestris]|uniref:Lipoprotein n=1 Tax=Brochothrix campestris FSL F6-1037 TaxID=1265861 RepID=W7D270_9LIST|nr:MetQ/NlpA family ABC transporter substrate-binding protein [Brochothrix campestris]EUJ42036.1 ABC transporter substrate-binding protein [Brochothrix campestris FSL F6-1037]